MTTIKTFSTKEALSFGWASTKKNLAFWIGFWVVMVLVSTIIYIISLAAFALGPIVGTLASSVAYFAILILMFAGLVKTTLRFCDSEHGKLSDLFSQYHLFFSALFATILYSLITLVGYILLIVPGIILGIKFWFFDYFVIDKKVGPIEALKRSAELTSGVKWKLFVFFLAITGINMLGMLLLGIGMLLTIPTTMMAAAFVYRKLLSQTESLQPSTTPQSF